MLKLENIFSSVIIKSFNAIKEYAVLQEEKMRHQFEKDMYSDIVCLHL